MEQSKYNKTTIDNKQKPITEYIGPNNYIRGDQFLQKTFTRIVNLHLKTFKYNEYGDVDKNQLPQWVVKYISLDDTPHVRYKYTDDIQAMIYDEKAYKPERYQSPSE